MAEFGVLAGLVVVLVVGIVGLVSSMTGGEDLPAGAPSPAIPAPVVAAAPQAVVPPPPPASSPVPAAVAPEPVNPGGGAFPRPDPRVVPINDCWQSYAAANQEYGRELAAVYGNRSPETPAERCQGERRFLELMKNHAKRTMHCMSMIEKPGFVEEFWAVMGKVSRTVVQDCAGAR